MMPWTRPLRPSRLVYDHVHFLSRHFTDFFGGSVYVDGLDNFTCEAAAIRDNYAGDQGGGIYLRNTVRVNNSYSLIGNRSPQGAALYIASVTSATFKDHDIADNVAYGGSVVYMTSSPVVASGVTFTSGVDLQEDSSNRAIHSNRTSALTFKECMFDGWLGDTIVCHENPNYDSLSLDSCDFRQSSPIMVVSSLTSDAKIRNAVISDYTFANTCRPNYSLPLVDQALDCSNPTICGPGECVNSTLGVLCECLGADRCLHDGGELSFGVKTPPASEIHSPEAVYFELVVSSAGDGIADVIWNIAFEAKDMNLNVAPSNGTLLPGGNVTVVVTGTVSAPQVGENLTRNFNLTSVGSTNSNSNAAMKTLAVKSTFYLCLAHDFATPLVTDPKRFECKLCFDIGDEGGGVNCDNPGATLVSLPIRPGYWRSGVKSLAVHKCGLSGACIGATYVLRADGYCAKGYRGPCESTDGRYSA